MLNADLKSTNRIMTSVLLFSRCVNTEWGSVEMHPLRSRWLLQLLKVQAARVVIFDVLERQFLKALNYDGGGSSVQRRWLF